MNAVRDWLGEAGVVAQKRVLKDIRPYMHLFPQATGKNYVVKRNAGVAHTVRFIPRMVKATTYQTERFAKMIVAPTLKETCAKIWRWVYDHIRYEKDGENELVRSARRVVKDGKGDCDCMTSFIDNVLLNVRKLKRWTFRVLNRTTKYKGPNFQHIYPVVITPSGEQIILDCVTPYFNYEEPYSAKQDHDMDLEFLDGIDSYDLTEEARLFDDEKSEAVGELGKGALLNKVKQVATKAGQAVKNVVHTVNKVNPVTLVLRNGLLAAMKLNILNVAGRIKWAYLDDKTAAQKKLRPERHSKLRDLLERLKKIFFNAGGDPENLKMAILTGKGNGGKEVAGFGVIPIYAMGTQGMGLREIIGAELFDRENAAVSGLGEPITAASITAATAALAVIAKLLKDIGPVKDGEPDSESPDAPGETVAPQEFVPGGAGTGKGGPDTPASNPPARTANTNVSASNTPANNTPESNAPASDTPGATDDPGGAANKTAVDFTQDPIGWVKENPGKTVLITAATAGAIYFVWRAVKKGKSDKAERQQPQTQTRGYSRAPREQFRPVEMAEY